MIRTFIGSSWRPISRQEAVMKRGLSSDAIIMALTSGPQLATQILNQAHQSLPWWAAIPCVTLASRALLLPLSLKARKAMDNIPIFRNSLERSASIRELMVKSRGLDRSHLPSLQQLARSIHKHEAEKGKVPGFHWAVINGAAQSLAFISLTSALRHMSTALWPGLANEGLIGLTDLTQPPFSLSPNLSAPHGTLGALIPLGLVLAYTRAAESSSASDVRQVSNLLKISSLPFYIIALVQPNSVLLSWAATMSSTLALQSALKSKQEKPKLELGCDVVELSLIDYLASSNRYSAEFIACLRDSRK